LPGHTIHAASPSLSARSILRMVRPVALVAALSGLAACDAGPNLDVDPWVELGGANAAFQALDGLEVIIIEEGPQGGYHIEVSVRATGIDWNEAISSFKLSFEDGTPIIGAVQELRGMNLCTTDDVDCQAGESGMGELIGAQIGIDSPSEVRGETVILSVTVSDRSGRSASDEVAVTLEDNDEAS
jgi:hypothetical protein